MKKNLKYLIIAVIAIIILMFIFSPGTICDPNEKELELKETVKIDTVNEEYTPQSLNVADDSTLNSNE